MISPAGLILVGGLPGIAYAGKIPVDYTTEQLKAARAANSPSTISEMKEKFNKVEYEKPFMGFSGLVFGLAERKTIEALCVLAATTPTENDLEFPDDEAAHRVLEKLRRMLKLS